jgi:hypothetical protein
MRAGAGLGGATQIRFEAVLIRLEAMERPEKPRE